MDVLMLGGTTFVGRWIVQDLLERGHVPTLFTRGRTGTDLFPGTTRLVGDRDSGDYTSLAGGRWDAVVDTCGYVPRHVAQAVAALGEHAGRYLFVSSGLVYDHDAAGGSDRESIIESDPRLAPYRESERVDDETYGRLKVACEDDLLEHYGARLSVVRPGWVVGPHDPSDQLTYWVRRTSRGDRMAVPGRPERPMQVIDVRDLARLVVLLLEKDIGGSFNATGPAARLTFGELLAACGEAELVTVPEDGVDFPLLLPTPSWDALFRISADAARLVGMPATPLTRTIADVRAWDVGRGEPPLTAGPTAEQEDALLAGHLRVTR